MDYVLAAYAVTGVLLLGLLAYYSLTWGKVSRELKQLKEESHEA